jgi:DNA-binding GntR family transcriptional regulator
MKLDMIFDTRKKMPLSEQFAEGIKILVAERKLTFGHYFDSIENIAEDFSLEKSIFLEGFKLLEKQGFVKFIDHAYQLLPVMLTQDFNHQVIPLYQAIKEAGYEANINTVDIKLVQKLPKVFKDFIQDKQDYIYIKRVYYANKMPMVVLEGYYPKKYFPGDVSKYKDTLFYKVYLELGHQLKASKRIINVVHPNKDVNELLYHPHEVASIQYISKLMNQNDEILEYSVSHASMNYTIYLKETLYKK